VEYERIVAAADVEVTIARQAAVEEVTAKVGQIVLAAAERVIGREIQAADHQGLIDEAIAAVRSEAASGAAASGAATSGAGSTR
jgi:F0F1-type ATP synthase membrane subunit b/b'